MPGGLGQAGRYQPGTTALAAAKAAFPAWAATSIEERAAKVEAVAARLLERLSEFASLLTAEQGKPLDQVTGKEVQALIEYAKRRGTVLAGGDAPDRPGYFTPPTIVRDIDEVIARANDSEYGLGGTIWGRDVARATEVPARIDSGTVWVNQHLAIDPAIPFRGSKQSGVGGELGQTGLHEYIHAHIVNAVELEPSA